LSVALGFTFNAANPIGVRFGNVPRSSERSSGGLTNLNFISTASAAAATHSTHHSNNSGNSPARATRPFRPCQLQETHLQTPTSAPASLSSLSNPPATAVSSPTQTNLNPAPLHWREAKPLVAAGQALLVDAPSPAAHDAGHIPEAISLPESSTDELIGVFLKEVPTNLTLIVYCSSTSCSQSKRMADRLAGTHQWGR
jgi:rhodanese-related sulfurtransferase